MPLLGNTFQLASFPLFGFATLHALTAGTDGSAWLVQGAAAAAVIAVVGMTLYRVSRSRRSTSVAVGRGTGSSRGVVPQQRVVDPYPIERPADSVAQRPGQVDVLVAAQR
jgi:hypothetical protein